MGCVNVGCLRRRSSADRKSSATIGRHERSFAVARARKGRRRFRSFDRQEEEERSAFFARLFCYIEKGAMGAMPHEKHFSGRLDTYG